MGQIYKYGYLFIFRGLSKWSFQNINQDIIKIIRRVLNTVLKNENLHGMSHSLMSSNSEASIHQHP